MKVEIKSENKIVFGDIYAGACFELNGMCYIKILDRYTNNNAVSLSSGNTFFIDDNTKVRVLNNAKVVLEE